MLGQQYWEFSFPEAIHDEPEEILNWWWKTNLFSAYHLTRALCRENDWTENQAIIFSLWRGRFAGTTAYPNGGKLCSFQWAMLAWPNAYGGTLSLIWSRGYFNFSLEGYLYSGVGRVWFYQLSGLMKAEIVANVFWRSIQIFASVRYWQEIY